METDGLQTPVAFFVFKRPGTTRRVFDAISRARPVKLLIVADGARPGKEGEAEACRQVREIVSRVNWPCEVIHNFSETNLGCGERMISGISWVFSQVEEAIILEDDCLPEPSFFPFCQELLERYRDDDRIAYISGSNLVEKHTKISDSYYYSQIGFIWGWATWRTEWSRYDRHLADWPRLRAENKLEEMFDRPELVQYWTNIFNQMYEKTGPDTWDYQWFYTCWKNHSLAAVPCVNLISNIGFGSEATHTPVVERRFMVPVGTTEFPLRHPSSFIPLRSLDRYLFQKMLPQSIPRRVVDKVYRIRKSFSS